MFLFFWPFLQSSGKYLLFSGVRMYHGYVPGIIWLQVIPDGVPQVVVLAVPLPLRTGTAVHVLFCFAVFHRDVFCRLFV